MTKNFILVACAAALICACQQEPANNNKKNAQKPKTGCCEAEKVEKAEPAQQAVAVPEVKVEKVEPVQQPTVSTPEVKKAE